MPRFQPGQSGNPKGRPKKGQTFTDILYGVLLEKSVKYNGCEITGKEAVARKLLELAIGGDMKAIQYIGDRIDGKPFTLNYEIIDEDEEKMNTLVEIAERLSGGRITDK